MSYEVSTNIFFLSFSAIISRSIKYSKNALLNLIKPLTLSQPTVLGCSLDIEGVLARQLAIVMRILQVESRGGNVFELNSTKLHR